MEIQSIKQRFGIIGNSPLLNTALETAVKVAPTDMNVLILGESGVGKESFSKIIHQLSGRKHAPFIAVNCGAIPEGTIDSELFGHEKGAFTGATDKRKGYFETVNGGTIFLDEVGELPLGTQARLLRILENGEFIKVGSSAVQKTDVRVVCATNRDLLERSRQGKFREDLYYRLATVPIRVPRLSERKEDIYLLFRKFASDFAESHHSRLLELTPEAQQLLSQYNWPGNVRQLKNVTEQICVLEDGPVIGADVLARYLPATEPSLPMLLGKTDSFGEGMSERDVFYKVLLDMRRDVNDLKKVVFGMLEGSSMPAQQSAQALHTPADANTQSTLVIAPAAIPSVINEPVILAEQTETPEHEYVEAESLIDNSDNLSLESKELELIQRALEKNRGKRKLAAEDLGISERTLYRKIKQYELD
ncbi:MAG: sigma-54-dependent Fis family transcriptional regulator [Bacteroidetes bacterium]|nr:sigma-54-dependent Fis family transcriptional regulator [Bacteroidota bacterium]